MKYYTGLQPALIPSFSGIYMDISLYEKHMNNRKKEILIFSISDTFIASVKAGLKPEVSAVHVDDIYKHFVPEDLAKHKAAIMLPHSVMSYMTTELYALGIPLFVPSMKYWKTIGGLGYDRTVVGNPYECEENEVANFEKSLANLIENSAHPYSPNVDYAADQESELYWLQMSDFYHWPHVQYFDNMSDLKKKLQTTDFDKVHNNMKREMVTKGLILKKGLCDIIHGLTTKST